MSAPTKPCTRCGGTGQEMDWAWFGARVRKARQQKGWSLRELARRALCSPAYVSDLELGRRGGGLSGTATHRIMRLLGLNVSNE